MAKYKKIILGLFVLLVSCICFGATAFAEESSPHSFSGTVTFTTDYVWRGLSQTDENIAVQGSLDYGHESGFYLGTWASNVDIGDHLEQDWYIGFANTLAGVDYDFMVLYYSYPKSHDDDAELDFVEFHVGLSHKFNVALSPTIGVGYDYSPDFTGEDDAGNHFSGSLDLTLFYGIGLNAVYGYQDVKGDKSTPDGYDWCYWKVGISKEILGFNFDLSYWDTNEDDLFGDIGEERVVFMVSRSL